MTFDAGAIEAQLTVNPGSFDADLDKAKAKVKAFEEERHEVKISAVFDSSDIGKARQLFGQLDNSLSRDAMDRLRSSPQGSVLGALNALFSPHPVTGAPTASQAGQQGLLGQMISGQGGGIGNTPNEAGPSPGTAVRQVLTGQNPQDTTTTDQIRQELTGQGAENTTTTDEIRQQLEGQGPKDTTTTDYIRQDVEGAGPKDTTTRDTVKEELDPAAAVKTEADAKASGDRAGKSWGSAFSSRLTDLFGGGGGGGGSGGGSKLLGLLGFGGGGGSGGALDSGLAGGILPDILGVSTKVTGIVGAIGAVLGTLPALAGIIGTGAGVAVVGGMVAGVIATSPKLKAQFTSLGEEAKGLLTSTSGPLVDSLHSALSTVPAFLKSLAPEMAGIFAGIAPQIAPIFTSLEGLIKGVLGVAQAAVPAFAPVIDGLLSLVSSILPGIQVVIRAMTPFLSQFAGILTTLGTHLGQFFSDAAPAIGASMTVLGALLDLVGALLPILVKLGGEFAELLAPVITEFGAALKSLLPFFTIIGQVIASFAQAVIGDLVSAFTAVAGLLTAIGPALTGFATALEQVFNVLENTGTFAILGDALEAIVTPLGKVISALLTGLTPLLPPIITFIGQLSGIIANGLASAIQALLPPLTQLATAALSVLAAVLPVILPLLTQMTGLFTAALVGVVTGLAAALDALIGALPPGVLDAIVIAVAGIAGGMKLWALAQAALAGSSVIDYIAAFAEVAAEAGVGETAMAAGLVALEAVSPVVWAVAAAAAVGALALALGHIVVASTTIVGQFQAQQQQLGYNIGGYLQLSQVIENAAGGYAKFAQSSTDAVRGGAAGAQQLSQQLSQQSAAVYQAALNMASRLDDLSGKLGVSTTTIEQWASAAGISASKFSGAGENVGMLTQQIVGFVNKNASAITATSSLSTNVAIFGNDVFNTTTQLDAFNGIWNTLVGNLLNKQMAVTQSDAQFQNLAATIKQNGANSTATAQSFQAYIQQIGSSVSTLLKNGSSIGSVNGYLQTQIDHLKSLGPLNKQQQADLNGLISVQTTLANSTKGLTDNQLTWIHQAEGNIIPDLVKMHADTPLVNTDVNNLANAIAQTGSKSSATAADRAQLIKDLESAGVNAKTATSDVNGWITSLSKVPKSVSSTVDVNATAQGTLNAIAHLAGQSPTSSSLVFTGGAAFGGLVPGHGNPRADDKLVLVSSGEFVMQADAVDKYGLGFMDAVNAKRYASGGPINPAAPETWAVSSEDAWATAVSKAFMSQSASAFQSALAAVAAAANAQSLLHPTGAGASVQALMQSMAAAVGWTGAEWTALNNVEMREAGYNLTAQNPTSDAYGLAQFILGPSEYAQYGGNSTTASGQITAMLNYIRDTYGDPIAAWQHELNYGYYDGGGYLRPGYTLAYNGSGQPEQVIPYQQAGSDAALLGRLDRLIDVTAQVPAGVGRHVGSAIGGAAQDASFRSRFPRGGA
jgi:hypothetical protein